MHSTTTFTLVKAPSTEAEWQDAVEEYNDWAQSCQKSSNQPRRRDPQPTVPIDMKWTLDDLDVHRPSPGIAVDQFLLLRVLFVANALDDDDKTPVDGRGMLVHLGVLPPSTVVSAETSLANDNGFSHLLRLVDSNIFMDNEAGKHLGRFMLTRRNLDILQRSRTRGRSPESSPRGARGVARREAKTDTVHVGVYATPKTKRVAIAKCLAARGVEQRKNDDEENDAEGEGNEKVNNKDDDNDELDLSSAMMAMRINPLLSHALDSPFLSQDVVVDSIPIPRRVRPHVNDDAFLDTIVVRRTGDETQCLMCIMGLMNSLFFYKGLSALEAVPERQLFRIYVRDDAGRRNNDADPRALLVAKVDAVVRWSDDNDNRRGDGPILDVIEVRRRMDDSVSVRMQHAAQLAAFVSKRARATVHAAHEKEERTEFEGGHVVLISQTSETVCIRVGVYGPTFADQMSVRRERSRPAARRRGDFMKVYTIGPFHITNAQHLRELCIILLALGMTHKERRQ